MIFSSIPGQHEGALPIAVRWIEVALLGSAAISIAILTVAILGFGMLSGRMELRAAARVALGAFILFSAPLIAYELTNRSRNSQAANSDLFQQSAPIPAAPQIPKNAPVNDPYAGAAVPQLQ